MSPDENSKTAFARRTFLNNMRERFLQAQKQSSGQALVEFALALPLVAMLLFAIIQYGYIFNAHMTLRQGTHFAAHTVAVSGHGDTARSVVLQAISPTLEPSNLGTVSATSTLVGSAPAVTVSATYHLPLLIRYVVPGAAADSFAINSHATYRSD